MIARFLNHLPRRFTCWATLPTALAFAGATLATLGLWSHQAALSHHSVKLIDSYFPLVISPDPVSLGSLRPGQASDGKFNVHNRGTQTIILDRVETSCPCLEVDLAPAEIDPGESIELGVRFDPAEEPTFRGKLSIQVTGYDMGGTTVFRTIVYVEVVRSP